MAELKSWLTEQIEQHKVEPNSGLGEAISYMLKHWEALTLFLRRPAAPLDNNTCEQALKKAILHRKNAYFYKTENGARVGDLFMSLIHTCELNKVNPFHYLTNCKSTPASCPHIPKGGCPTTARISSKGPTPHDKFRFFFSLAESTRTSLPRFWEDYYRTVDA